MTASTMPSTMPVAIDAAVRPRVSSNPFRMLSENSQEETTSHS